MRKRLTTKGLLATTTCLCALLTGCRAEGHAPGQASSQSEQRHVSGTTSAAATATAGTTVGPVVAEVELKPVGDSKVRGSFALRKVGDLGVQVELEVSGLPKQPAKSYYAQLHQGECSEARAGEGEHIHQQDPSHEHDHGGVGPKAALIRLDRLLVGNAWAAAEYANGGHDHGTPAANELPGNIDEPIGLTRSADGTAFTTTLLEGVMLKEVLSGNPKYLDLHAADIEYPQALACVDLDERG